MLEIVYLDIMSRRQARSLVPPRLPPLVASRAKNLEIYDSSRTLCTSMSPKMARVHMASGPEHCNTPQHACPRLLPQHPRTLRKPRRSQRFPGASWMLLHSFSMSLPLAPTPPETPPHPHLRASSHGRPARR